jgi:hypothetical protein
MIPQWYFKVVDADLMLKEMLTYSFIAEKLHVVYINRLAGDVNFTHVEHSEGELHL